MSIKFEGLDEVYGMLDDITDLQRVKVALGKAAALVERSAKQNAVKGRTGELANSITSKVELIGNEIAGIVYTPLEYAPYVEYGTGLGAFEENGSGNGRTDVPWSYQDEEGNWHTTYGMPPQPFMRPALNENREKIKEILKEGMVSD